MFMKYEQNNRASRDVNANYALTHVPYKPNNIFVLWVLFIWCKKYEYIESITRAKNIMK